MNIDSIRRRTERAGIELEANEPRNFRINVQYCDQVETPEGRKEVYAPATYDDVDWEQIKPLPNGDRIAIRFPKE